ncbi:anti-sigma-factor antagonist [Desulfonatronospira thiodismutans ASO3-1]|uniref:Anti-sigma factor antagonist n=1 Tax=Desulfonatronospira thiodismutans ASO3-1 TaxID=555779 RepID=D6SRH5_9BACT|nr:MULTISPECIES: STAS domain-containing protein [Desulfonatronospira]EFI33291.1 anti-sigma-factor antagonist [Desulfonatronospira thiodismutans ASO3-1]RQD78958.1 MAG: anti-sigma factor antagonist [Desulfonatronospira sp. MSAO_Bac3]
MERVHIEDKGNMLIVDISREMTMEIVDDLKKEFEDLFSRPWQVMALDLSGVAFMDSAGIGFVTALNNRSLQEGRKFCLLNPSEQVIKTLKLVNLWDLFATYPSLEEISRSLNLEQS